MSDAAIDRSAKPEPWRSIGLQFRAEGDAIMHDKRLPADVPHREGEKLRDRRIQLGLTQERATDLGTANAVGRLRNALDRVEEESRLLKEQPFKIATRASGVRP